MRTYLTNFYSHRSRPVHPAPSSVTATRARIREVAVIWFRRVFGWEPSHSWVIKGSMASAWDRRGNYILITQVNHDQLPGFDTRTGRFTLALHQ